VRNSKVQTIRWLIFLSVCVIALGRIQLKVSGNQDEDEIRDLTRTSWTSKRPHSATRIADTKYRIIQRLPKAIRRQSVAEDSEIGVTLWHLRPARSDDPIEIKELVQPTKGATKEEWTPERITSNAALEEGQMVRLSIESLRTGFLYVINRAKYKDGSYSDPYLIFPTKQIYGGNNKVEVGRAIQIPGPEEEPFMLQRDRSRGDDLQVSEELIILVTSQPLQSFLVAPTGRQKLTSQSVANLLAKYASPYEIAEKVGGTGNVITIAEKRVAKDSVGKLSAEDPYPQTIYRLTRKPSETMLLKIELQVRSKER